MTPDEWLSAALRGEPVEWGALSLSSCALLAKCEALEVSELLHHQLARNPQFRGWPADVRTELARRAHESAARQLVRSAEIAQVLQLLASNGIRAVVFKGAALSHLVYDSPALRPHTDADVLVRRSDVETVRQVLSDRGYAETPMTDGELVLCQFQMVKTDRLGIEHVVDVHWKISTQSLFADVITFDEISDAWVPQRALAPAARGAGGAHALLLACLHPVMHHRNVDRLIWFYDVHLLVSRLPRAEVERFASLAMKKGIAGICARQLAIASEYFHTQLPDVLATCFAPTREPSAVYLRAGRRWHHELWWNVRSLGRWRDRVRLLREVLLPSPQYMLHSYHLGASGVLLLPVLYVHRSVHGVIKILTGRK
jgi:Uncharacterised nucleotidyltransferase